MHKGDLGLHAAPEGAPAVERWRELIDLLRADLDAIAERFAERARSVPAYRTGPIPQRDVRRTARESIDALLALARDHDASTPEGVVNEREIRAIADRIGVRRARADVALDDLMSAVRLDFSIIWDELIRVGEPRDAMLLVTRANSLWLAVDHYADRVRESYLNEREVIRREASAARHELLERLIHPAPLSSEMRTRIRDEFGFRDDDRFLVAFAHAGDAQALEESAAVLRRAGIAGVTHGRGAGRLAIWAVPRETGHKQRLINTVDGLRVGVVDDVDELDDLASATHTAARLAASLTQSDRGALRLTEGWARLARAALREEGVDIRARVDRSLRGLRGADREALIHTILGYLELGSVSQVAEHEFCHRNTVLNRLRRFEQLTGLDVTVPDDAALVVLAWR